MNRQMSVEIIRLFRLVANISVLHLSHGPIATFLG